MVDQDGEQQHVEEALADASDIPSESFVRVTLFSRRGRGSDFESYALNPTSELADEFRVSGEAFAREVSETRTLVSYVPGRRPDDFEVVWLPVEDVPELQPLISRVESDSPIETFDPASSAAKHVRISMVSVYKPNPGWVHFVRQTSLRSRLRSRGLIAAVLQNGVYDRISADVLLFERTFDAIVSGDVAFLTNQGQFERAIGFYARAGQAAQETLDAISNQLRIRGIEALRGAVGSDSNMIAKLRGIKAKMDANPAYARAMTMEALLTFIGERSDLALDVEGEPGREELVFHSDPRRRWRILKLLDDDFLHSELTQQDYEANSKVAIGEP